MEEEIDKTELIRNIFGQFPPECQEVLECGCCKSCGCFCDPPND